LRAIVTADVDLDPADTDNYRVAFAEAFSKRGIKVRRASFSSTDSLLWESSESFLAGDKAVHDREHDIESVSEKSSPAAAVLRDKRCAELRLSFAGVLGRLQLGVFFESISTDDEDVRRSVEAIKDEIVDDFPGIRPYFDRRTSKGTHANLRDLSLFVARFNAKLLHDWLTKELSEADKATWSKALGLCLCETAKPSIYRRHEVPSVDVHSARISRRHTTDGKLLQQLIVQVAQRRRGYYLQQDQDRCDQGEMTADDPLWKKPDFVFRGGATVHVDLNSGNVTRIIHKNINDQKRLERQRGYLLGDPAAFTFAGRDDPSNHEPFAFVHRGSR